MMVDSVLHLKNVRVFMIEDSVTNVALQTTQMELAGAVVGIHRWGTEGIIKIAEFIPDIILLDLHFPKTTGYEIFAQLKQSSALRDIPVVAVSASDPTIEMPKTRQYGFNGFISKPIDLDMFTKQIRRIIDGEKIWFAR